MKSTSSPLSSLTRTLGLAASVVTVAAAALVFTPGVSSAADAGGSVVLTGGCTPTGYPEEVQVVESFSGLSTTNTPGYQTQYTYTDSSNTVHTFNDGNWETDPDHSGDYSMTFFIGGIQPGTGYTWRLTAIDGGAFDTVLSGAGAISGQTCTPENPPFAPSFGDLSDTATNAGVVTVPLDVAAKTTGRVEFLNSGNGVIAAGDYDDSSSTGGPLDTDVVNVKIQLTKAQLANLWWVQFWSIPAKITSTNTFGTTTTNDSHGFVEPAAMDKATFTKSQKTIKVSKVGKYTVAFSADPSAPCALKVKLGSTTLNHDPDYGANEQGEYSQSYKLPSSALKQLKHAGKEKVTLKITVEKGPSPTASSSQVVTLKAPKS